MFEIFILGRKFFRHLEKRQKDVPLQVEQINLVNYFIGIIDRFRKIVEYLAHFRRCFKIKLVVWKYKTFVFYKHIIITELAKRGRGLFLAGVDAKQDIMRVKIGLVHVM